jgi:hypothetical protein
MPRRIVGVVGCESGCIEDLQIAIVSTRVEPSICDRVFDGTDIFMMMRTIRISAVRCKRA